MSERPPDGRSDGPARGPDAGPSAPAWAGLRPVSRALGAIPVAPTTGSAPCACRDCFIVGSGGLCLECEEADCQPDKECEVPHAYCAGDERYGDDPVFINGKGTCPVCGEEF